MLKRRRWRSFKEARKWARLQHFSNQVHWRQSLKPFDIPKAPHYVYKRDWVSWGDWLGTGYVANQNKKFRPFVEARQFVRSLNLKSVIQWQEYARSQQRPFDIPSTPSGPYKTQWINWGDWLGNRAISTSRRKYRSFGFVKQFAHNLGVKSEKEWRRLCAQNKIPIDIPSRLEWVYSKQWRGWRSFLGTDFDPFISARHFVRRLGIKSFSEWKILCSSGTIPKNIPRAPWAMYPSRWKGLKNWFGPSYQKIKWRNFTEARVYARKLKVLSCTRWYELGRQKHLPDDIPTAPEQVYKSDWKGWVDWLGTTKHSTLDPYRSFHKARKWARSMGLRGQKDWRAIGKAGKRPTDIPSAPWNVYKHEWKGLADWLNTRNRCKYRDFQVFEEARLFVHNLCLRNCSEWRLFCKSGRRPDTIPCAPDYFYKKKGWSGYRDWLGKEGLNRTRSHQLTSATSGIFLPVGVVPAAVALRILNIVGRPSDQSLSAAIAAMKVRHKLGQKDRTVDITKHVEQFEDNLSQLKKEVGKKLSSEEHACLLLYWYNHHLDQMHKDKKFRQSIYKAKGSSANRLRRIYRGESTRMRGLMRGKYVNGDNVNFMQALATVNSERNVRDELFTK